MNPEDIPLRDLHLPEPVGLWPLAPGWWVLIAIAAAFLAWGAWRLFQRWRRGSARRAALNELARLQQEYAASGDTTALVRGLSALTRRAMLAYAPRLDVAGLTGSSWLRWLDRGMPEPVFENGPGQGLESLPYRATQPAEDEVSALVAAVRDRLRTPLPEEHA